MGVVERSMEAAVDCFEEVVRDETHFVVEVHGSVHFEALLLVVLDVDLGDGEGGLVVQVAKVKTKEITFGSAGCNCRTASTP